MDRLFLNLNKKQTAVVFFNLLLFSSKCHQLKGVLAKFNFSVSFFHKLGMGIQSKRPQFRIFAQFRTTLQICECGHVENIFM